MINIKYITICYYNMRILIKHKKHNLNKPQKLGRMWLKAMQMSGYVTLLC